MCKVSSEDANTEKTQDMISVHKELIGFLENYLSLGKAGSSRSRGLRMSRAKIGS